MRYLFIPILLVLLVAGCGVTTHPSIDPPDDILTTQQADTSSHYSWGEWEIFIDPENLEASVALTRRPELHLDVTSFIQPPKCYDCLQINVLSWNPTERLVIVNLILKNPTSLSGYDVKAVASNYGTKELLNPDAFCDFFTDGSTWDPYWLFAEGNPQHEFGPNQTHSREVLVYFPVGANGNATIKIDTSWPGPQEEPFRIDNVIVPGPLQNDGLHYIGFTCQVRDNQNNVNGVSVDLAPVGPGTVNMGDDGLHRDYIQYDGIWGIDKLVTTSQHGFYDFWIKAGSDGTDKYTYQRVGIEVINPLPVQPTLYIVSMMHAEEQQFFLNQTQYMEYADDLVSLAEVFAIHNSIIAFQPDWTFIQGTTTFYPNLFNIMQTAGHGVDAHAHESQYNIGQVHDMLDAAGVLGTIVANGGYTNTWMTGDQTWAAYIAHFSLPNGDPMFNVTNAWKWPATQESDALFTPIRPSLNGDWMVHNPDSPIVYIPGAVNIEKSIVPTPQFFTELPNAVDEALLGVIPEKINCAYWHDSLHNYGKPTSNVRITSWNNLLASYFDPKVASGELSWADFSDMLELYLFWE